jgi:hypothetical protein
MTFTNLDTIARRFLLEKGLSIHFYLEVLSHAATCLRELNIEKLRQVKTARLALNSYYAVDLPDDFLDDVAISLPFGGMLKRLSKLEGITPLRNVGSTGAFEPYSEVESGEDTVSVSSINWFWNTSDYGELTGRFFGANGGASAGYQVFKERRQIQFSENFAGSEIVLQYISDGQSPDNATQIDLQAWATINAFIAWKTGPNADIKDSYEARTYYNEKRLLGSRLSDLTIADVKNILRKNYTAAAKG